MNLLDRLILALSPRWGASRAAWRAEFDRQKALGRNWDAARMGRLDDGWSPRNLSPEETDGPYRDRIRARARDLERNNDIALSAVGAIERNVVGCGILPQARVMSAGGAYREDLNDKLEELWEDWAESMECDLTGQMSFSELQALVLRRRVVDGEAFVILSYDEKAPGVPLRLQVLEGDCLDGAATEYRGRKIRGGVEVNDYWRPLAYWFRPDPLKEPVRVERERVLHLFRQFRPRQVRGVSELAVTMQRIRDSGEFIGAELVAARVAACFSGYITQEGGFPVGRFETDEKGRPLETMEPGTLNRLRPGEKIDFSEPGHPNSKAADFVQLQQRLAGAGLGMSYELMSRDMSRTNYSSARQAHLEDRRLFEPMQQYLIRHLCRPVWRAFVDSAVLAGLVRIPGYERDRKRYQRAHWVAPGWSWIDPAKEASAYGTLLDLGLTTREELCAGRGKDWAAILEQQKREREYAEELGVRLGSGTVSASKDQGQEGGEEDEDDGEKDEE